MESPVFRQVDMESQDLVKILKENNLHEFIDFIRERELNTKTVLNVTEADVKLWKINTDAQKFVEFIKELKSNTNKSTINETTTRRINVTIEHQYQTVNVNRKAKERSKTIDEIMKNIVPAKSFLYRYQKPLKLTTPYAPMDAPPKKTRKFFRMSSYDYPFFDLKSRFSRSESDRGYYSINTNTTEKHTTPEIKRKYKSLSTTQELKDEISEDHFYEDLCYNDLEKDNKTSTATRPIQIPQMNVKPFVKIQELFNSFKIPFFKREETQDNVFNDEEKDEVKVVTEETTKCDDNIGHLYENNDCSTDVMYDYPVKRNQDTAAIVKGNDCLVEDYLEPIPVEREYCDIGVPKEESLLTYIMNILDNFSSRKDTSNITNSEGSDMENKPDTRTGPEKPKKVNERKLRGASMADRPLPVPVENEPYYMNISRVEAENLLLGHPDGTFILRPTTQPNHAYTISVACCNSVHNVGVRRRSDGRLALGYARKGERSFTSIASLLRHHRKRRLVLVASGGVLGATTLNESPVYYQTPTSLPVLEMTKK